jgi:hypothetical protein
LYKVYNIVLDRSWIYIDETKREKRGQPTKM